MNTVARRVVAIGSGFPRVRSRSGATAFALLAVAAGWLVVKLVSWAIVHAVWTLPPDASSAACRAIRGEGACWAVIHERARFILFGGYPFGEQWRAALVCVIFIGLLGTIVTTTAWNVRLVAATAVVPIAAALLLRGGFLGLRMVPSDAWGGLPLTLLLSTAGFVIALPPAVALALGRRSRLPAIRLLSVAYIELIRGIPIVAFLFMASVILPLVVPPPLTIDKLARAQIAFVMVIAAYLAEVIRGGLQAVPEGQYEAAASMGLSFNQAMALVVLPQALRSSIPSLVNTYIAFFKDTSLVAVVGLFDLLGAGKAAIVDRKWVGFGVEVYLFAGAVYFVFCYTVSRYSRQLERALAARYRQ